MFRFGPAPSAPSPQHLSQSENNQNKINERLNDRDQLTSLKSLACKILTPSNARFNESKLVRNVCFDQKLFFGFLNVNTLRRTTSCF